MPPHADPAAIDPLQPDPTRLRVSTSGAAGAPLSKAQKAFNTCVEKIHRLRRRLQEWQQASATYQRLRASDFEPLHTQLLVVQVDTALALAALVEQTGFTKTEMRRLHAMVGELTQTLLTEGLSPWDPQWPVIHALHLRFGEADDDGGPPDDSVASQRSALAQKRQQDAQTQAERQARAAQAKKSQASAPSERAAAKGELGLPSLREVYRKLVSALHPDREPDAAARERKTALMKRVNQAYEKKDLLQLLELQLEVAQIDALSMAGVSEQRLLQFNAVLNEQLRHLRQEISACEQSFFRPYDRTVQQRPEPAQLLESITWQIAQAKHSLHEAQNHLSAAGSVASFKAWLKAEKLRHKTMAQATGDDGFF